MSSIPDWSKLPDDPLAFFELSSDFDRKSLKRVYGKLIKEFRPETHPAEFQKIRQAYEVLENQQRYGVEQSMLSNYTAAWEHTAQSDDRTGQGQVAEAAADNNFSNAIVDPHSTYRRLKSQASSPQDYFLLATLSDLIEPREKLMYLKWLLTGVQKFPRDPGLLRLLAEYLSAFAESQIALSTLVTLAKLVGGDEFLQVTERLWLRLLRQVPFETWAKTLQRCDQQLRFRNVRPRLAFLMAILRRALWVAPKSWVLARKQFVEQHGSEIDNALDDEVELLNLLIDYRYQGRDALQNKPIFSTVDQLIQTYCCAEFEEARPQIAALCDEIARNSNALADSFPTYAEESDFNTLMLVSFIAFDMATDSGLGYPETQPRKIEELADAAVSDISSTIHALARSLQRMRIVQLVLPFLAIAFGPLILFSGFSYWPVLSITWFAMAMSVFFLWLRPRWLEPRADERSRKLVLQAYESQWRPRLFRYVQACHAPASQCISQLANSGELLGEKRLVEIALSFAERDQAIQVFSRLQLFLH
jgi:hypothetical protein